jgi:hypothetical protein
MTGRRPSRFVFQLVLLALAGLHVWLAASVSDKLGVTSDEIAHLTAGTSYWTERDYRLQPENGLLPQRLAALPLALSPDIHYPDIHGDPTIADEWARGGVWNVGARYFFESGNDLASLLQRARWMIALLGGFGIWLIGDWARRLAGPAAGLFAATLAAFSPTLLAHAGLATSDTAGAVGFLAATAAWWRLCHRITPGRILAAGLAAGVLALCKYSAVLFAPIAALLLIARLLRRARLPVRLPGRAPLALSGLRRLPALGSAGLLAAALAIGVIWAGYGFRYEARGPRADPDAGFDMAWDNVLMVHPAASVFKQADGSAYSDIPPLRAGAVQAFVRTATHFRLLPEPWLYGLAFVDRNARYRAGYLAGDWRMAGWWWFFPFAALIKSTPAELLLASAILAALLTLTRGRAAERRLAYRCLAPLTTVAIYGAVALQSNLNIGHRHILPLYTFGFVLVAVLAVRARRLSSPRLVAGLAVALLISQAAASLGVRPHYLAYFNPLAGGPDGGHRFLVDSSLDWGQGLPSLKAWLGKNVPTGTRVYLSSFGSDRPGHHGIEATRFGDTYFRLGEPALILPVLEPGLYVFSATMWQRVYTHARGPWNESLEHAYWRQFRFWASVDKPDWDGVNRDNISPDLRYERLLDYEHLRFGRLCRYLASRAPDAIVAHQYLVFQLNADDLRLALQRPLPADAAD